MLGKHSTNKKNRPISVTVLGVWLIFQGIFAFGYMDELGEILAILLTVFFISVGVGLLKLYKSAYYAALIGFILLLVVSIFYIINIYNSYPPDMFSYLAGQFIASGIFSGIIILVLLNTNKEIFS